MSVSPAQKPINAIGIRTRHSTKPGIGRAAITWQSTFVQAGPALLFAIAALATLTISAGDSVWVWSAEGLALVLATVVLAVGDHGLLTTKLLIPMALLMAWGFVQLALGATVHRYATLDAAVRFSSYGAVALLSAMALWKDPQRKEWLRWFSWFATALSVVSVLAYYTSPQKILWILDSPYPENWGPFASRNNFAQFLELAFPIAMCRFFEEEATDKQWLRGLAPAILFASGVASASRAGAIVLLVELLAVCFLARERAGPRLGIFALASTILILAVGAGTLIGRFGASDPLSIRREVYQSTRTMIAARPWSGTGLGTFQDVYPEYALFDPGARVDHAHNDWLEWSAEGGLPFAAVWWMLAILLVRPALRSIWGVGTLAVLLHAAVDYPFARFGIAVWFFALCGMLLAAERGLSGDMGRPESASS